MSAPPLNTSIDALNRGYFAVSGLSVPPGPGYKVIRFHKLLSVIDVTKVLSSV